MPRYDESHVIVKIVQEETTSVFLPVAKPALYLYHQSPNSPNRPNRPSCELADFEFSRILSSQILISRILTCTLTLQIITSNILCSCIFDLNPSFPGFRDVWKLLSGHMIVKWSNTSIYIYMCIYICMFVYLYLACVCNKHAVQVLWLSSYNSSVYFYCDIR